MRLSYFHMTGYVWYDVPTFSFDSLKSCLLKVRVIMWLVVFTLHSLCNSIRHTDPYMKEGDAGGGGIGGIRNLDRLSQQSVFFKQKPFNTRYFGLESPFS